jgi:hypothetical protein
VRAAAVPPRLHVAANATRMAASATPGGIADDEDGDDDVDEPSGISRDTPPLNAVASSPPPSMQEINSPHADDTSVHAPPVLRPHMKMLPTLIGLRIINKNEKEDNGCFSLPPQAPSVLHTNSLCGY